MGRAIFITESFWELDHGITGAISTVGAATASGAVVEGGIARVSGRVIGQEEVILVIARAYGRVEAGPV